MDNKYKVGGGILLVSAALLAAAVYMRHNNAAVLSPHGLIASKERNLMELAVLLMLIVVIPVFGLLFSFIWKYRESNTEAKYTPDWDRSRLYESIWWGVPSVLILALSVITWVSTHQLDPSKSLTSSQREMTIQVVALDWKWLFIYPEQNIASVNFVQFPKNTPINFEITADAPMNSFWIPQLGGQIYAMPGMSTQMHLIANTNGNYRGSSSNISGKGFAGMKFVAKASSEDDFKTWVNTAKQASQHLSTANYVSLLKPSENNKITLFSGSQPLLYDTIIEKYMSPGMHVGNDQ